MAEEIKLIVDALTNMSGMALYGFMIYFIYKLLAVILCWTGAIILTVLVIKTIKYLIVTVACSVNMIKQIRDTLGIGNLGLLYESELCEVQKILPDMIDSYKKTKETPRVSIR